MKIIDKVDISNLGFEKIPDIFQDVIVEGNFDCSYNSLTSLEGAPEKVGGDFYCSNNAVKFTEEQVRAVCDVKGRIFV